MMLLEIQYIKDAGDIENERIVMKALADCDIGNYFTFLSHYVDKTSVSTEVVSPFWFVSTTVCKGDIVVVYTKEGKRSSKVNKDGSTSYFYYRNETQALCKNENVCAVLLEVAHWKSSGKKQ